MELSWLMKLRIAVALAAGGLLIGFWAWPLAAPSEPFGVVSVLAGGISLPEAMILAVLAAGSGLLAYFLCWPFGRQIAVLAVPAGLAVWAVRSGNVAGIMQLNPTLSARLEVFATFKWEPLFWLAIVGAGFLGVLLGQIISKQKIEPPKVRENSNSKSNKYLNPAIALVGSVVIAQFCIRLLAQDVRMGSVVAQPAAGQIVFAVLISFALAGFLFKKFLNAGYIWPVTASALVTAFTIIAYVRQDVLGRLVEQYPPVFFANAVTAILPIQMVAFGTLGSIAGYWLAVRYNYWRQHESK